VKTSDHSVLRLTTCLPLIIAGLVWLSLHFLGCQTLVTTNRPPSPNRVEGMLYYLPIGKITIKGDYGKGESTSRMKSDSAFVNGKSNSNTNGDTSSDTWTTDHYGHCRS